ncbi:hypothetical protein [Mucilaginibacter sp.]|uniref:hypothetical protein n=1 Tax=Mucilaginibacter sp. TaxID=1882438 RepID=UPI003563BAD0
MASGPPVIWLSRFTGRNSKDFTYNMLNLPATVSAGISYTYDATAEKLKLVQIRYVMHFVLRSVQNFRKPLTCLTIIIHEKSFLINRSISLIT